nr:MAG TPA: hypothetical protein [Caudoviricetes sp.]
MGQCPHLLSARGVVNRGRFFVLTKGVSVIYDS